MNLLAISGSLRAASTNTALLRAAEHFAPDGVTVRLLDGMGDLPIFNPDREGAATPASVLAMAARVAAADGLVFSCPEYAHGIPGGLKNALDWLVSRFEVIDKPALLVHASPRGSYVREALTEVLRTMSLRLSPRVPLTVPLIGKTPDEAAAILAQPAVAAEIVDALRHFAAFIAALRAEP